MVGASCEPAETITSSCLSGPLLTRHVISLDETQYLGEAAERQPARAREEEEERAARVAVERRHRAHEPAHVRAARRVAVLGEHVRADRRRGPVVARAAAREQLFRRGERRTKLAQCGGDGVTRVVANRGDPSSRR